MSHENTRSGDARECAAWVKKKVELRGALALLPQSIFIAGKAESERHRIITGNCAFTTEGLGVTPGNQFSLIRVRKNARSPQSLVHRAAQNPACDLV